MEEFIKAIEKSISSRNWYAALLTALTIPDICGYLEDPRENSQPRYEKWFEHYMLPKYSSEIGAFHQLWIFLSPSDCYALRCAILHEGSDSIIDQRAHEALEKFRFTEPPISGLVHCNQRNKALQLQVDIFCRDIIDGANQWSRDIHDNIEIDKRMTDILKIYKPSF